MIRICLFFSHDDRTYVATYTSDEAAIATAREIGRKFTLTWKGE